MKDLFKNLSWKHLLLAALLVIAYNIGYDVLRALTERNQVLNLVGSFAIPLAWKKWGYPLSQKLLNKGLGKPEETEAPQEQVADEATEAEENGEEEVAA